ncbi:TraB/GumN family protein [Alkaliphilus transvaalensis]|uniref:TraB/GumN family protein n=1 Tax=Alkaliphilus transvaalensis TaxID=114628 RepID=UPI00047E9D19|nr:TraB/GumN family protein [Alkaliphilus transvaalensis]
MKKMEHSNKKSFITGMLVVMMFLSTFMPVWAVQTQMPDISQWAVFTLNEGEKYGIYPIEWYYQDFRSEISLDRLEVLLKETEKKIAATGAEVNSAFAPLSYKGDTTRGDLVIRLYNILGRYGLPVGDSPVEYMQARGILQGTSNGLALDQISTTEQAVVLATRLIEDTYGLLDAGAKGLIWKVEHNNKVVYLLGSIHIGKTDLYPLNQKVKEAFFKSDVLLVEANVLNQEAGVEYFLQKATYQDGTRLSDEVSEETFERLTLVLNKYGIPTELVETFKPWSIANELNILSMSSSENPEDASQLAGLGIDMYFLLNALLTQKPIYELEGIEYQADLFDNLTLETQEAYLNGIIDSILEPQEDGATTPQTIVDQWFDLWVAGDIEGFSTSFGSSLEDTSNELSDMLLGQRDIDMAAKIMEILNSEEEGTYFVVVGAGHLVTEETILYQLEKHGFEVELFY